MLEWGEKKKHDDVWVWTKQLKICFVSCEGEDGCETWTLLAPFEKRIQTSETEAPEKTSPYLLLGAQDQRLGAEQGQTSL